MAQFGHLINLDLIGPLLKLLEDVFSDAKIPVHSRLKAGKSACTILSGQGEDLLVDPKHLYANTFRLLNEIDNTPKEGTSGIFQQKNQIGNSANLYLQCELQEMQPRMNRIPMISVKPFKLKNRDKIDVDAPNPNLKKGCDRDFLRQGLT